MIEARAWILGSSYRLVRTVLIGIVLRPGGRHESGLYRTAGARQAQLLLRGLFAVAGDGGLDSLAGVFCGVGSADAHFGDAFSDAFPEVHRAGADMAVFHLRGHVLCAVRDSVAAFGVGVLHVLTGGFEVRGGRCGPHTETVERLGPEAAIGGEMLLLLILLQSRARCRAVFAVHRAGIEAFIFERLLNGANGVVALRQGGDCGESRRENARS